MPAHAALEWQHKKSLRFKDASEPQAYYVSAIDVTALFLTALLLPAQR